MDKIVEIMEKYAIKHCVDYIENEGEFFKVKGWIFSQTSDIDRLRLVATTGDKEVSVELPGQKRVDVAHAFHIKNMRCGFGADLIFRRQKKMAVFLEYQVEGEIGRIHLCDVEPNTQSGNVVLENNKNLSFKEFKKKCTVAEPHIAEKVYNKTIDLIVPVYNGFEYLENLFKGIERTKVPYRLFVVDDCSPDERVLPLLRNYAKGRENVTLIENKENLGFVATVNKALKHTKNHVALINTDVILPTGWLERLMTPILEDDTIASTTPYSNSATICSFPNFCENNDIFLGLDVEDIDHYFAKIKPRYVEMPTGVGFCMGMNRKAIKKVGALDAKTFYKGYGEENDWCQRAIRKGFRNVQVENLFAWHKHGGSFASEDKQRYIDRNLQIIGERYPTYHSDVAKFIAQDPNSQIREFVKYEIIRNVPEDFIFIVNHNWGGGANTYLNDKVKNMLAEGKGVVQLIEDVERGLVCVWQYKDEKTEIEAKDLDEVLEILEGINCSKIFVNEMVSFTDIREIQSFLIKLKEMWKAKLLMLCHDFFAVCPSIYLINDEKNHCFLPEDMEQCRKCYKNNLDKMNSEYDTLDEWREMWGAFLEKCDEVIAFSENTKSYFQKCYPKVEYTVIPHQVDYIEPVGEYEKTEDIVTIGIIGNLMYTKGAEIVHRMLEIIEDELVNARIVVIGPDLYGGEHSDDLIIHGSYKREELPELLRKYEVDIVFIASIWPETFSYTTEEAIKMGVRVASFDIGAPAERIKKYDKGLIISEMSADAALREIMYSITGKKDTIFESERLFEEFEVVDNLAISQEEKEIPKLEDLEQDIANKEKREEVLNELGKHVFDWYPFDSNSSCLIVGDNSELVKASVEKQLEQISVINDINEVDVNGEYDYIILTGISDSKEIKKVRSVVASNGKILLMADNRIGLRYLTGTADVHTGRYFAGVNNYVDVNPQHKGFTKKELLDMVDDAGISNHKFYYLYPNEKTVKEVFTDITIESYEYGKEYYNFDFGTLEFYSEKRMAETLCGEKVISEFANFFVMELSSTNNFAPVLYAKINGFRKPMFQIMTEILEKNNDKVVKKTGLTQEAVNHVQKICDNHEGGDIQKCDAGIICEFIDCVSMNDKITQLIKEKNLDAVYDSLSDFFDRFFENSVETTYATDEFVNVFGDASDNSISTMQCIKPANIDMICDNIMLLDDGYSLIDEEWIFDFDVPVKFILWRNIRELFATNVALTDLVTYDEFLKHFGIDETMDQVFLSWTNHFVREYVGTSSYEKYAVDRKLPDVYTWYLNNYNAAEAKLYFDFGNGYSEENVESTLLETSDDNYFEISYTIPEGVTNVMWKPVELRCCECVIDVEGGVVENHNGITSGGITKFQGGSAQYDIKIDNNTKCLIIRGHIKMYDLLSSIIQNNQLCGKIRELYYEKLQLVGDIREKSITSINVICSKNDRMQGILQMNKAQIKGLKQDIRNERNQLINAQEQLTNAQEQLAELQRIYNDIMKSKGWKFVQLVRRILLRK